MEKIRQKIKLIDFIRKFHFKNKVITYICIGAQLLISARIVKNNKIVIYYRMKDNLINAGAIYTDLSAAEDNKIVTTAHYKDMGIWMKKTLIFFNET